MMLQLELRLGNDKFWVGDRVEIAEHSNWAVYTWTRNLGIIVNKYRSEHSHNLNYVVRIGNSNIEAKDHDLILSTPEKADWEV